MSNPPIGQLAAKAISPLLAIFVVPYNFLKYPFSFHYYARNEHSLAHAISFVFEVTLLQLYFQSVSMERTLSSISDENRNSENLALLEIFSKTMSAPISSGLYVFFNILVIVLCAIPSVKYLDRRARENIQSTLIVLVLFSIGFVKIIESIQVSPAIISQFGLLDPGVAIHATLYTAYSGIALGLFVLISISFNVKRTSDHLKWSHVFAAATLWLIIYLIAAVSLRVIVSLLFL